eukprot:5043713-Alexandrium_andersonii.AAC.1
MEVDALMKGKGKKGKGGKDHTVKGKGKDAKGKRTQTRFRWQVLAMRQAGSPLAGLLEQERER